MNNGGWPLVQLGEVIKLSADRVPVSVDQEYPNFGIYSFGRGLFVKPPIQGAASSAAVLFRAKANQFVYSRLFAFEGAYGTVPEELNGYFVSNEFPLFDCDTMRLLPSYLGWYFRNPRVWPDVARLTTGMGNRRQRIQPASLFTYTIPLPPLEEQRRIVGTIASLANKVAESSLNIKSLDESTEAMLLSAYRQIIHDAPRRCFGDVAPLMRRPAIVDPSGVYPQVSVRSFGRGTFHNPPLLGSEITWEKPHLVKLGDILISNIKAWEGAIAVAREEDDGRYGSHRYLTFVPKPGLATGPFLCFHLLTSQGLLHVGAASPGSADRNRTLSSKAMLAIPVPVPPFEKQLWFDRIQAKVADAQRIQAESTRIRDSLLPSILDRAFKGGL